MAKVGFLMSLEGATQGRIHGPVVRKIGNAFSLGWIECHAFDFETESPRDPQSGLPTGHRRFSSIRPAPDSSATESFRLPFGFVTHSGGAAAVAAGGPQAATGSLTRVSFGVISPRDAQSGLATGKRSHKSMVIHKVIDATSPLLLRAAIAGESMKTATLAFSNPGGGETLVKLLDATLVKIGAAPHHLGYRAESLSLVYENIWINGMPGEDAALQRLAMAG